MSDLYFTEAGDLALASNGDLATTASFGDTSRAIGANSYTSQARDLAQQAFIRIMTEVGDYALYPDLGASLDEKLTGLPNTPETVDYAKSLIRSALTRGDSALASVPIFIKAVPISPQAIRFDIFLTIGSRTEMALSIQQNLDTTFALEQ